MNDCKESIDKKLDAIYLFYKQALMLFTHEDKLVWEALGILFLIQGIFFTVYSGLGSPGNFLISIFGIIFSLASFLLIIRRLTHTYTLEKTMREIEKIIYEVLGGIEVFEKKIIEICPLNSQIEENFDNVTTLKWKSISLPHRLGKFPGVVTFISFTFSFIWGILFYLAYTML